MIKRSGGWMFILTLVLSAGAFAQGPRMGMLVNAGGYFPVQDSLERSLGTGLGAAFRLKPGIALAIELKYIKIDVEQRAAGLRRGTLFLTPVLASLSYRLFSESRVSPYIF
ncbi:MAG: hypothetical protein AB1715_08040, partial [Acidobacteriota bacterium]